VEGLFLDLRRQYMAGDLDREAYVDELAALADRCRGAGLLRLSRRDG
jgi:hypothetical protein